MKTALIIMFCKALRYLGKILGRGSSLPGQIALKMDSKILCKISMPNQIIAVTGSNGKTSTVEMIAYILKQHGKRVAYNMEGSNQIEGVTTFILADCDLKGKMRSDILLMETDERFAKYTFQYFTPTHYVITNLYRDQLTRNGHPEWVYRSILESIREETILFLNADDPLVSCFGIAREKNIWFGVDQLPSSSSHFVGMYDDGRYCPNCKAKMRYEYYHYNHIGKYQCESCGFERKDTQYSVTKVDFSQRCIEINRSDSIQLSFCSLYNIYNVLAACAVSHTLGVSMDEISDHISNFVMKTGRVVTFRIGQHEGTLLTAKHENSISYDQSLQFIVNQRQACTVVLIVDAISRKYFTSDTSWLWDIHFELLHNEYVNKIILSGLYCNDLAVRFSYCNIPKGSIEVIQEIQDCVQYLEQSAVGTIYTVTCFSDKGKFLSKVEIL